MPTISVIVPCYLQAQYLHDCLNSVMNQTFTDWECIIVDDGSPDNTANIVSEFVEKDKRFTYKKFNNAGVSAARNKGINLASGTFILPLDGDDIIQEKYIEKALQIFRDNPSTTLVYCNASFFGEKNEEWYLPTYSYKRILRENIIFCSAIFYKHKAISVGLYNESLKVGLEDWEFFLRLLDETAIVVRLNETLFNYRIKKLSRSVEINNSKIETTKVHEMIYNQHQEIYKKYYGDVINMIKEAEVLRERISILTIPKPKPARSLKNLIKFLRKQQIVF